MNYVNNKRAVKRRINMIIKAIGSKMGAKKIDLKNKIAPRMNAGNSNSPKTIPIKIKKSALIILFTK
jgi:hypothetical protein